tara:strand:- start:11742 stop:12095 length:354 start_codon:yes stop_codon:yes gene_type:complete
MEKVSYTYHACQKKLFAIDDALYAIGGKWKLKIIIAIRDGHIRFNDLQRTLGISAKMLSQELKDLELNGFLERRVHTGTPVVVEYMVTEYSDSLDDILRALSDWGENHRDKIKSERS